MRRRLGVSRGTLRVHHAARETPRARSRRGREPTPQARRGARRHRARARVAGGTRGWGQPGAVSRKVGAQQNKFSTNLKSRCPPRSRHSWLAMSDDDDDQGGGARVVKTRRAKFHANDNHKRGLLGDISIQKLMEVCTTTKSWHYRRGLWRGPRRRIEGRLRGCRRAVRHRRVQGRRRRGLLRRVRRRIGRGRFGRSGRGFHEGGLRGRPRLEKVPPPPEQIRARRVSGSAVHAK